MILNTMNPIFKGGVIPKFLFIFHSPIYLFMLHILRIKLIKICPHLAIRHLFPLLVTLPQPPPFLFSCLKQL